MKNLLTATKTMLLIGVIGAAAVGCKQTTSTAPVDTAATTAPAPSTAAADTSAAHRAAAPRHSGAGDTAMGSSHTGSTGSGSGAADGMKPKMGVKNNTGETQGTTPNTSLPVSDGSR